MPLPSGPKPWFGLSPETLRFLEIHQARAVAIPGRSWRDFGDAVMLFSATEKEPFSNRLTAVRWPEDPRAFDGRLREAMDLFAALDRKPYLWAIPGLSTPSDLIARLSAHGFTDQGGGYDMILLRDPAEGRDPPLPRGAVLERWNNPSALERPALAEALALVLGDAFQIPPGRRANLIAEIGLTLEQPHLHACLVRVDGEPVATGERYTFDGASYLSSIGTRPAWRGLGLGRQITHALARDSLAGGVDLVYLGVHADNARAIRLYDRLGFGMLGPRSSDMLLERPR
ncbi:MAG: GNAT family N-acetyltransferase [Candidatus Limnocylindrales bacterium]|jgi:ribosomal protein S18 acetylase RimI-like enzyme